MWRALLSTRNTPLNSPSKGTTAELKIEFAQGIAFRGITGLPEYRHTTSIQSSGLSSQGMFVSEGPCISISDIAFLLYINNNK
jgi:hypothetical protein